MIDAMYSFVNITDRLDQLVLNPISTHSLDMTCVRLEQLPARVHSLDQRAVASLCRTVLPRIRGPVHQLIVDQFALDDVLRARYYSELRSLVLVDIDEPDALDILRGKGSCSFVCLASHDFGGGNSVLCKLSTEQITTLVIDMSDAYAGESPTQH